MSTAIELVYGATGLPKRSDRSDAIIFTTAPNHGSLADLVLVNGDRVMDRPQG